MAAVRAAAAAVWADALPPRSGFWLVGLQPGLVRLDVSDLCLVGLLHRPVRLAGPAAHKQAHVAAFSVTQTLLKPHSQGSCFKSPVANDACPVGPLWLSCPTYEVMWAPCSG